MVDNQKLLTAEWNRKLSGHGTLKKTFLYIFNIAPRDVSTNTFMVMTLMNFPLW